MARKITDLRVKYISLVKNPANMEGVICKSADFKPGDTADNFSAGFEITKYTPDGLIYGTVYPADKYDSQEDWTDPQELMKAAILFAEEGNFGNVDTNHNEIKNGGKVVMSHYDEVEKKWKACIKMDPASETFKDVQSGKLKGFSLGGVCKFLNDTPIRKSDDSQELAKLQKDFDDLQKQMDELKKTATAGSEKAINDMQAKLDTIKKSLEDASGKASLSQLSSDLASFTATMKSGFDELKKAMGTPRSKQDEEPTGVLVNGTKISKSDPIISEFWK